MNLKYSLSIIILITSLLFNSRISYSQKVSAKITYQQYIEMYRDIAIKKMQEYRIPASITLAQGLLESGSGNSDLATNANNHFGIKCHKEWTGMTYIKDDDEKNECFRKYTNPEESFNDHSLFLTSRPRYSNLFTLDVTDYKGWAHGLKAAGYATNPRYAELLIKIIEENQLYLYDSGMPAPALLADNNPPKPMETVSNKAFDFSEYKKTFKFVEVTNGNRNIYTNNGVRLIFAREGDNIHTIADDLGMHAFQVLQYNELGKHEKIKEGSIIYVEPKKKKANKDYHVMSEGETMRDVAQIYAVKLKVLYKRNKMKAGHEPEKGTTIFLKKNKI